VGAHRSVQTVWANDGRHGSLTAELVAMVDAEHGTATLRFSDRARPQTFVLRLSGTELSASASVSGRRVVIEHPPQWRRPITTGRRAVAGTIDATRAALASPWERLGGGPGLYVGIHHLIDCTYTALRSGVPLPVSPEQIRDVNRLRADIIAQAGLP